MYIRIKISNKLQIIKVIDDGVSKSPLAIKYGVARFSILNAYNNRDSDRDYLEIETTDM